MKTLLEAELALLEATFAKCDACKKPMSPGGSCALTKAVKRGRAKDRDVNNDPGNCHDCNCGPGKVHHFGCDMENCPFCGDQMGSCECIDELV